jgi:hypothetical protein
VGSRVHGWVHSRGGWIYGDHSAQTPTKRDLFPVRQGDSNDRYDELIGEPVVVPKPLCGSFEANKYVWAIVAR